MKDGPWPTLYLLLCPDGGYQNDVEEDADDSEGHVQHHHQPALARPGPSRHVQSGDQPACSQSRDNCVLIITFLTWEAECAAARLAGVIHSLRYLQQ